MSAPAERDARSIINDLRDLTNRMMKRLDDPDYLIDCIEKRQLLMEEYDAYAKQSPGFDKSELKKIVGEILAMDSKISTNLAYHKNESKRKLSETRNRQRAMNYSTTAASGSFMNNSR